jgi:hypothetical protein
MALAGLSLLMETSIASAQIFQWTDVKGVIHFTDNPYSIPESIRNSSALIVRKDMDTKKHSSVTILTLSQRRRSRARPAVRCRPKANRNHRGNLRSAGSDRGGQPKFRTTERSSLQLRQQLQTRLSSRLHRPAIYSPERV